MTASSSERRGAAAVGLRPLSALLIEALMEYTLFQDVVVGQVVFGVANQCSDIIESMDKMTSA